jgi:hypothetical protein
VDALGAAGVGLGWDWAVGCMGGMHGITAGSPGLGNGRWVEIMSDRGRRSLSVERTW